MLSELFFGWVGEEIHIYIYICSCLASQAWHHMNAHITSSVILQQFVELFSEFKGLNSSQRIVEKQSLNVEMKERSIKMTVNLMNVEDPGPMHSGGF